MIEAIRHLSGACGEPHGLLHAVYIYGSFVGVMILYIVKHTMWWVKDRIL